MVLKELFKEEEVEETPPVSTPASPARGSPAPRGKKFFFTISYLYEHIFISAPLEFCLRRWN